MAKSREKVQQLGFWDTEVTKPDHDTVCLWAYNNTEVIFRAACPKEFDRQWDINEILLGHEDLESRAKIADEFKKSNPRPNPRITKKSIEYVLRSYTGYQDKIERIIGFADLLFETEYPKISVRYKENGKFGCDDIFDGFEIVWSRNRWESPNILVEAKSILPTVGELMRQIQLYRTAFHGCIVVVSPDEKYKEILSEQGVAFVKYPL